MGYLACDFIFLGFACIYSKAEWLIPVRKYLAGISLTLGFSLSIKPAWLAIHPTAALFFSMMAIGSLILLIRNIIQRHANRIEVLHLPANSYEIVADDRPSAPTVQLRYRLLYQDKIYTLSSTPPADKPALTLYAKISANQNQIFADITIDSTEGSSFKLLFHLFYGIIVLAIALMLPWLIPLQDTYYALFEKLFPSSLLIIFGYLGYQTFKSGKDVLLRFLYWFTQFLSILGWFTLLTLPLIL